MRKVLGLLSVGLLSATNLLAQFDLEHSYEDNGYVSRILVSDDIGVKYVSKATTEYEIYNEDHSLWKTISFDDLIENSNQYVSVNENFIGKYLFDDDDDLELLVSVNDFSDDTSVLAVIDENGVVQHSLSALGQYVTNKGIVKGENESPSYIVVEYGTAVFDPEGYTKVYDLQTFELAFEFDHGNVMIESTENGDNYLVAVDDISDTYKIYDLSGALIQTIPLPAVEGDVYYRLNSSILTKNLHDTDDEFELLIGYDISESGISEYHGFLLSQNGDIVQNIPSNNFFIEKDGDDFLAIRASSYYLPGSKVSIYNLEMSEVIHEYEGQVISRYRLDGDGEMITVVQPTTASANHIVYHEDASVWQEKSLEIPPGTNRGRLEVSSTFFNDDAALEYSYSYFAFFEDGESSVIVQKQDGTNILNVAEASYYTLSRIPGAENKMLVVTINAFTNLTEVYAAGELSIENFSESRMQLYPNPIKDVLYVKLANDEKDNSGVLFVYDLLGNMVHQQSIKQADNEIHLEKLEAGVYYISTESGNLVETMKFVKL